MNDRAVSLFEKYDLTIENTKKGRGAIIAETDKGMMALTPCSGSLDHLAFQELVLREMSHHYNAPLDTILRTRDDELFCTDFEGKKYVVKKCVEGRECNVSDAKECKSVAEALAGLHLVMRRLDISDEVLGTNETDELREDFERRTAEIVRTRNFIRKCSRKEEFDLAFLGSFDRYMEQASMATEFLDDTCIRFLKEKQRAEKMLVHGDCTQHNALFTKEGVVFVNFEKMGAHLQLKDVYLFMRKILEKNNWSYQMAADMLEEYESVIPLEKEERMYLYSRFLYPEKFWKIANGYLNRRKSVPARRQQEKLSAFEQMEEKRQLFLNKWLETCR